MTQATTPTSSCREIWRLSIFSAVADQVRFSSPLRNNSCPAREIPSAQLSTALSFSKPAAIYACFRKVVCAVAEWLPSSAIAVSSYQAGNHHLIMNFTVRVKDSDFARLNASKHPCPAKARSLRETDALL